VSTKTRKFFIELPLMFIGITMIVATFSIATYFQNKFENYTELDTVEMRGSLTH